MTVEETRFPDLSRIKILTLHSPLDRNRTVDLVTVHTPGLLERSFVVKPSFLPLLIFGSETFTFLVIVGS